MKSEGWFVYAGNHDNASNLGLVRETFELDPPGPMDVLAQPLYGAWEGNMGHTIARSPIDTARQRREEKIIIGNAGVVRVLKCGSDVKSLEPGQLALIFSACELDPHGYPQKILGYDAPKTMGCLAAAIKISSRNLIALPNVTAESLPRWAAFSVRYMTAWSNWQLSFGIYRLMVPESEDPVPNVWGWGGGTTLGELDLARRCGCRTVMLSGNELRLATIEKTGVTALDRRQFGNLQYDKDMITNPDARRAYTRAETAFLQVVDKLTNGRRVQIFVDNIGTPVFRATSRALAREGIIATVGWKEGMEISYLRASACINRQQHVNTHFARLDEGPAAVKYAQENDWLPHIDTPIYSFDDIPKLARDFAEGNVGLFPVYQINPV